MQVLDKLKLIVRNFILRLKLIILMLEATNCDLKQLILPLAFHRAILVEFVLRMLIIVFLLPCLDLLSQFLLGLLLILRFATHLGNRAFKLLDFDVLELCILLGGQVFHRLQQLLLLALDLDVVGGHVLILVLLKHFGEVLVESLNAGIDARVSVIYFFPELLSLI